MTERMKACLGTFGIMVGNIAGMFGLSLGDNIWVQLLAGTVMLVLIFAGCWTNFNFSEAAAVCQKILDAMKRFDVEVVEEAKKLAAKAIADEAGKDRKSDMTNYGNAGRALENEVSDGAVCSVSGSATIDVGAQISCTHSDEYAKGNEGYGR